MPKSTSTIAAILTTYTALSDADYLSLLKLTRDQITARLHDGDDLIEIEIRGRRSRVTDPVATLEWLNATIDKYESKNRSGPARSRAKIIRQAR